MIEGITNRKKVISYVALIAMIFTTLFGMLFVGEVYAAENSAEVRNISILQIDGSDAKVSKGGKKEMKAAEGMKLGKGYTVSTGKDTILYFQADDNKAIKLAPSSSIVISEASKKKLSVTLKNGEVYFNVKKPVSEDSSLEFNAGGVTMGIRGTDGFMSLQGSVNRQARIGLFSGKSMITTKNRNFSIVPMQVLFLSISNDQNTAPLKLEPLNENNISYFCLNELIRSREGRNIQVLPDNGNIVIDGMMGSQEYLQMQEAPQGSLPMPANEMLKKKESEEQLEIAKQQEIISKTSNKSGINDDGEIILKPIEVPMDSQGNQNNRNPIPLQNQFPNDISAILNMDEMENYYVSVNMPLIPDVTFTISDDDGTAEPVGTTDASGNYGDYSDEKVIRFDSEINQYTIYARELALEQMKVLTIAKPGYISKSIEITGITKNSFEGTEIVLSGISSPFVHINMPTMAGLSFTINGKGVDDISITKTIGPTDSDGLFNNIDVGTATNDENTYHVDFYLGTMITPTAIVLEHEDYTTYIEPIYNFKIILPSDIGCEVNGQNTYTYSYDSNNYFTTYGQSIDISLMGYDSSKRYKLVRYKADTGEKIVEPEIWFEKTSEMYMASFTMPNLNIRVEVEEWEI